MHSDWNPGAQMNQEMAGSFLTRGWDAVSVEVLDDAWALYKVENA
jgi:hypothetical protein